MYCQFYYKNAKHFHQINEKLIFLSRMNGRNVLIKMYIILNFNSE